MQLENPMAVLKNRMLNYLIRMATAKTEDNVMLRSPYSYGVDFDMGAYQQSYRLHPWVFRCVSIIAQNVAQLPLYFSKEVEATGKTERVMNHEVIKLFKKPNSWTSTFDLFEATMAFLELNGNAYWWLLKNASGKPTGIICLRPDRVRIVPNENGKIIGFLYTVGDKSYQLLPEETIHFKYFNPYDEYYGQPTLQAATDTLNQDMYARKMNTSYYKNSAIPAGGIKYPRKLKPTAYKKLRADWKAAHGGPSKYGEIAIFEEGMDWVNIGHTHQEMEYIQTLKLNRNEFGSVYGIPPLMLGDYDKANYNNSWQQVAFFWHETAIPRIFKVMGTVNRNMDKLTGNRAIIPNSKNNITASLEVKNSWALKREAQLQAKTDDVQIKNGTITINEIRERDGREPLVWGDEWWTPVSNQPAGSAPPGMSDLPPDKQITALSRAKELPEPRIEIVRDREREFMSEEWKRFALRSARYESPFRSYFVHLINAQEKIVLRNFWRFIRSKALNVPDEKKPLVSSVDIDLVLFDMEKAIDETIETSAEIYTQMMASGGRRGFRLAHISGQFDITNPRAQRIMGDKQQKFAKKINATTWNKVKHSLEIGIKEGDMPTALANRIEKAMATRRANKYTVARTEVIGTLNGGTIEGYEQTEVVIGKEWVTADTEATREAHALIDGEVASLNRPFSNGLSYPGDPSGAPEDIINCMCTTFPKLEGE